MYSCFQRVFRVIVVTVEASQQIKQVNVFFATQKLDDEIGRGLRDAYRHHLGQGAMVVPSLLGCLN